MAHTAGNDSEIMIPTLLITGAVSNQYKSKGNFCPRVLHQTHHACIRTFLNFAACIPAMNARCIKSFSRPVMSCLPSTRLFVRIAQPHIHTQLSVMLSMCASNGREWHRQFFPWDRQTHPHNSPVITCALIRLRWSHWTAVHLRVLRQKQRQTLLGLACYCKIETYNGKQVYSNWQRNLPIGISNLSHQTHAGGLMDE